MSGITALSASASLLSGATVADNSVSGFVTKEQIVLGVTGSPTTVLWSIAKPTESGSYVEIDSNVSISPVLTPDVPGYYTISCIVDSVTQYVLRILVASVANITTLSAIRFAPILNSQVPTPASGATMFYSIELSAIARKLANGTVVAFT